MYWFMHSYSSWFGIFLSLLLGRLGVDAKNIGSVSCWAHKIPGQTP